MRNRLLLLCLIVMVLPCLAQSPGMASCSPAGTWYGGSEVKYLFTITPITGERFAIRAEILGDVASAGIPAWTSWSGQLIKVGPNRYQGQYISMYTSSPGFPPAQDSFEVDGVRGYLSFIDCDNMKIEYDFYLVYFDMSKIVFVDQADITMNISGSVETYRRVPMTCPACNAALATTQRHKRR